MWYMDWQELGGIPMPSNHAWFYKWFITWWSSCLSTYVVTWSQRQATACLDVTSFCLARVLIIISKTAC